MLCGPPLEIARRLLSRNALSQLNRGCFDPGHYQREEGQSCLITDGHLEPAGFPELLGFIADDLARIAQRLALGGGHRREIRLLGV